MAKLGREARKRIGKAPKAVAINEMVELLKGAQSLVFANNKGITLSQATAFRKKARENKVVIKVVKNTLLRIAMERAGHNPAPLKALLNNETIVAIGLESPATPAKIALEFAKGNEKFIVKGGYLQGNVLDIAGVEALSKLPTKEEMVARMLGSLMSPASKVVYALNAAASKIVYVVDARRRQLEGAA